MRVVHLADLHLGFKAYRDVDESGRNVREVDVMRTFFEVVDSVGVLKPDLVVVAGDVFDAPRVSNRVMAEVIVGFKELCFRRPVVIAGGNHDRPFRKPSEGNPLGVLAVACPDLHIVTDDSRVIDLPEIATSVLVVPDHCDVDTDAADKMPNGYTRVLVVHAGVQDLAGRIEYAKITKSVHISELMPEKWAFVAVGDFHSMSELAPNAWYSGSIDAVNAGPWDQAGEQKGFLVFDTDTGEVEPHYVATRPVMDLEPIDCGHGKIDLVNEEIARNAHAAEIEGKIVRQRLLNVTGAMSAGVDRSAITALRKQAMHYRLHEFFAEREVTMDGVPQNQEGGPVDCRPMAEVVDGYVMETWEADVAVEKEAVRDAAVELLP